MASQTWKIFGDEPSNFAKCGGMGAYDLASGKWLWTQKDPEELMDEGYIGLANGRLYYYVAGKDEVGAAVGAHAVMACREAKTGKIVWENPKAAELVAKFPPKPDTRGSIGAILCTDKAIVLHKATCGTIVMSAETGDPLWTTKAATVVLYKNLLLRKGGENWGNPSTFDLLTGTPSTALGKLDLGGGCGQFTITPNLLCGQIGLTYDFKASQSLSENGVGPLNHKTSCLTGSFVAEGQVLYDGVSCVCDYSVRGTIVQGAAVALPDPAGLAAPERLVRSDDADRAAPCIVDGADWPTFRASNVRANASAAKVPAAVPAVRWTWTPATPAPDAQPDPIADAMKPNAETPQAVAVGNLVFASGADGSVTALDLVTGQVKWRFFTRARLYAPPTIAEGRCYIGSGDGIVYCLEATTGRQLWLYGAAPRDRRIMVYGDLVNTWPITGGVVVQDGVAYAAAGMFSVDNTTVVALDAKTGAVKWRNDVSGSVDAYRRTGVSAAGYPAVAQGKFWIRSSSYDLATGACAPFADPDPKKAENFNQSNAILNRYTGFFAGKYLMAGGRRFFDDPARSDARPGATNLEFVELAADGTAKLPLVKPWGACRIMPAWDDRQTLALPIATEHPRDKYTADLQCWDTPKMVESLDHLTSSGEHVKNTKVATVLGKDPNKGKGEKFEGAQTWSVEKPHILAAVLGANAAVASYISEVTPGKGDAKPTYTYAVAALDRATGTPMWEAPLPGEPLMDGLSLARDGSVLVRMLDGSLIALAGK
jgi:outer membrane protein assembly factor BamB